MNGAKLFVDDFEEFGSEKKVESEKRVRFFDSKRFSKQILEFGITHAFLFPTLVENSFDGNEELSALASLKYWIVGAEKLPKRLMERALRLGVRILQIYGNF